MMGEVYIMVEGRIVKIDLDSETGYSEVDWDESDLEYDENESFVLVETKDNENDD